LVRPDIRWAAATQSNRRRLIVFLATLIVALGVSLAYTWLRPPEYRASARLEITPGSGSLPASGGASEQAAAEPQRPFLTEVQVLVSRPVLEQAAASLQRSGEDLSPLGADPVGGMQAQLRASPVADTHVVELVATGGRAVLLAPLVNTVVEVYQNRLAEAYRSSTGETLLRGDDEVNRLEQTVSAKRRDVEAFRRRNDIVSLERDENDVLSRVRNLSTSLSAANDKVAAAEGKLRALHDTTASGRAVRSRGDSAVANLDQRVAQMREELRELERQFTPDYLAKDPKVVAERARLAELEHQLAEQRVASQQTALADAQDELSTARATAARLREQMAASRQEAAQFSARFNEYKSLQGDLEELEKAHREAVQRRARLEASERARMPSIRVLEAAITPLEPWRPLYWRDTAISLGGSLVLALLAMWLVELFNRPESQPSVVLIQPQAGALRYEGPQFQALADPAAAAPQLRGAEPALLPRQPRFPRELGEHEVTALVRAAEGNARLAILLLLSGLDVDEVRALCWRDFQAGLIRVGGDSGRAITVGSPLRELLQKAHRGDGSQPVVASDGRPITQDGLDGQILCAAHDASLDEPTQVTSASVRHTYLAFLVRQGMRFADLTRLVGTLPAEVVGAYSALSPPGVRIEVTNIALLHPGLRQGITEAPRPPGVPVGPANRESRQPEQT
jgi:polysaccharide biosynthesis transport protein